MTKLDSVSFDTILAEQDPFGSPKCRFDLTGINLITPAALVQLATACYALAREGRRPVITIDDAKVRLYLARTGFFTVAESVAQFEPELSDVIPSTFEHLRGSNPMLIEVTKIDSGAALPSLLNQIAWVLRYRLRYRKYDAFDIAVAVSEICQNTFDHNSSTAGFIAMQVYSRGAKRFLEIGVADYGDGLATTLRRNPKYRFIVSDLGAIQLATKLGTSEHDDPTRGTGLYHLLELIYRHEGSVQIRSGSAKVRYRMDKRRGWSFNVSELPGVQIALNLPSKG